MIDIGTTTLQAARHLHGKTLTVVTSSLAVYEELVPDEAIELILPGGTVRRNYQSLVGMLAESALRQLKADVLFLGTSAVDARFDVWDSTMVEVPIKRAMIEAAAEVVLLADAEKFSMAGLVRVCEASEIDRLVTDAPPPAGRPPPRPSGRAWRSRSRLEDDLRPAVVAAVEVLVGLGRLVEAEAVRDDERRLARGRRGSGRAGGGCSASRGTGRCPSSGP